MLSQRQREERMLSDPERLGFEALDAVLENNDALSSAARNSHQVYTVNQNLALTVLYVPESGLDCLIFARIWH